MKSNVCYASLAIYSKVDFSNDIFRELDVAPSRSGEKAGNFHWIYSTQEAGFRTVEKHLEQLMSWFEERTTGLKRLVDRGAEIRIWVYFGVAQINQAFVISPETIRWLAELGADVCVDVWTDDSP
jgi:hypothetical protein